MSPLSIIISFSSEYDISESEKKYAQLKHVYKRKQSKTVLNNCVGNFFKCERTKGDGLFYVLYIYFFFCPEVMFESSKTQILTL